MKRVFKTRHFSRWMRKTELTDSALCSAVAEMAHGLIDAANAVPFTMAMPAVATANTVPSSLMLGLR